MTIAQEELFEAAEMTWPAARVFREGAWTLRDGQGGGKRVSAATAAGPVTPEDIAGAESAMQAMGQQQIFMIRGEDSALDQALDARGYKVVDPVHVLVMPVAGLTDTPLERLTTFTIWEPLAIMAEIWAKGGIGPARLAVMARAATRTAILARCRDKPAGVAFVAVHGRIAMVHAVEVLPGQRRQGVAQRIMRQAAFWAQEHEAETIAVLCTKANASALALYHGLGFVPVAQYHYRARPETGDPSDG